MMHCVRVIVQNFGFWSLHYVNIVFICVCIIFQMNVMIWHEFWAWFLLVACVNREPFCNSRSGEPGSPRRDWHRQNPCVTRPSRAGEGV